ncbi:MAG: 16S rRNA (adenine(1518)-N(6)/adenine(1519)-N(6))-dimethyltransferase RsmA [Oscillospiraceae bacterium]|nr:16S rRNA (adenine(1518)-N(6)/adenine(1519)-N(6))-dimethyltransferase RsmA [Oscillospiraceae bacterium]
MPELSNIGYVKDILSRHGFSFSKKLGQNFIVNPSVCPRMAELGGAGPGVGVIEVGPGLGVLTRELTLRADKVVCIELDSRLIPVLDETLAEFDNVSVLNEDVLKVDLARLIREEFPGLEVVVCANLPYYITSPIVMSILEARLPIRALTVMVQKEAAERICAAPGGKNAGAVSAAVSYYSRPQVLFQVSRGSFMPAPEVDSAVIRLDIRESPAVETADEGLFFRVIRAGFSQRRKTLSNSLSSGLSLSKPQVAQVLTAAGVLPTARAEELTLENFAAVARALGELSRD